MKIAFITDIHEDILSLKRAFRKIDKISPYKIICLGDISGFNIPFYSHFSSRDASACLDLVRKNCDIIVVGNHDLNAINRIPEISPEFSFPKDWYDLDYDKKKSLGGDIVWLYEENELNPLYKTGDKEFLSTLNEIAELQIDKRNVLLSHYVYPNLTGATRSFFNTPKELSSHFEFMKEKEISLSIVGHAHPTGLLMFSRNKIYDYGFRRKNIPDGEICLMAPSITKGGKPNGFLIIDIENNEVEAIKI